MKNILCTIGLILLSVFSTNIYSQCVSGDCINGEGTMIYSNNAKYWGNWKDGKREGYGVMVWYGAEQAAIYRGNWSNDKRNGLGTYCWPSGNKYEGNWLDSKSSGHGTYYWPSGNAFVGEFINDVRTENGTIIENAIKKGCVSGDCNNGYGKYYYTDGAAYDGYFKNGKREGKGKIVYWNDDNYEGDFINGLKNGKGKYIFHDGTVYEGDWNNDKRTGKGTMVWGKGTQEGDRYEGDFVENKLTGYGKYTYKNGTVEEGKFLDNVFKGTEISLSKEENNNQSPNNDVVSGNGNNIILYGYNVGQWRMLDNSQELKCEICKKNCAVKKTNDEIENDKTSKINSIINGKSMPESIFKARLNFYRNQIDPPKYTFENYLEENPIHASHGSINLYKPLFAYSNILYNPFYVGYFCSEAHLKIAETRILSDISKRKSTNQSQSNSSSPKYSTPNGYQCSDCLKLSMGNKEPLGGAFGGCHLQNGSMANHDWWPVNTNCQPLHDRNTVHYESNVCGLQCRDCGEKCYILSLSSVYVKCPKNNSGSGNHHWEKF